MTFVFHSAIRILSENNARHTVILWKITADNIIIVFQVLALDPILCPLIEIIPAVLSFGDNPFKLL